MKILSLFDGMACGMLAMLESGVSVTETAEPEEETTDLSDAPEEIKDEIVRNAERLSKKETELQGRLLILDTPEQKQAIESMIKEGRL